MVTGGGIGRFSRGKPQSLSSSSPSTADSQTQGNKNVSSQADNDDQRGCTKEVTWANFNQGQESAFDNEETSPFGGDNLTDFVFDGNFNVDLEASLPATEFQTTDADMMELSRSQNDQSTPAPAKVGLFLGRRTSGLAQGVNPNDTSDKTKPPQTSDIVDATNMKPCFKPREDVIMAKTTAFSKSTQGDQIAERQNSTEQIQEGNSSPPFQNDPDGSVVNNSSGAHISSTFRPNVPHFNIRHQAQSDSTTGRIIPMGHVPRSVSPSTTRALERGYGTQCDHNNSIVSPTIRPGESQAGFRRSDVTPHDATAPITTAKTNSMPREALDTSRYRTPDVRQEKSASGGANGTVSVTPGPESASKVPTAGNDSNMSSEPPILMNSAPANRGPSSSETSVVNLGDTNESFEELFAKFQSDISDLKDLQNQNKSELLDMDISLSTSYFRSLQDQFGFLDAIEDLENLTTLAEQAIAKYSSYRKLMRK